MKRYFLIIIVIFIGGYMNAKTPKLGVIDVEKLIEKYPGTGEIVKKINNDIAIVQKKIEAKEKEIKDMQKKSALLPPADRAKQESLLKAKLKELADYTTKEKNILVEKKLTLTKEMVKDIKEIVKKYAEKNGYDIILNKNSSFYTSPNYDITKDVIRKMFK